MDALGALLDGPRARDAFVLRASLDPPFALRVEDRAPLTLVTVLAGSAWVGPHGGPARRLAPGDLLLARGPDPYTLSDEPGRAVTVVVRPGNVTTDPDGALLCDDRWLGPRAWGERPDGGTVLLVGTYSSPGAASASVLAALPPLVVLPRHGWDGGIADLLAAEAARDAPGQDAVVDRLLDVVLVAGLRAWLTRPDCTAPGWYRGRQNPAVAQALRLMHSEPATAWTVGALAARAGVSRATLARRFTDLVGQAPMAYLTSWRLALGADLLAEPGVTVAAVSRQVGYATPFAFSAAFKRERGRTPQEHRRAAG